MPECENCAHADMVISSVVAANEKLEKENDRLTNEIESQNHIIDKQDRELAMLYNSGVVAMKALVEFCEKNKAEQWEVDFGLKPGLHTCRIFIPDLAYRSGIFAKGEGATPAEAIALALVEARRAQE